MSVYFEELDFRPTPMGVLSLRRRRSLTSDVDIYEIKLGDEFLMSSAFTVAEIELARLGRVRVTGLDISHTFVTIASQNAKDAGVAADFHQGDAAAMPFEAESFDLIVCQAAFKNFVHPRSAISEMYRVLRGGGTALIQDMSSEASHADIEREVAAMQLGPVSTFTTKGTLEMLKRRAYSPAKFERLAAESPFGTCTINTEGIGLEVRLEKPVA